MCFDPDSSPPIEPVSGGAARHRDLTLQAADGSRFAAFEAFADRPGGAAVVILPDVRGLFRFYEELAERLAEAGHDALAIDYFGRTAGVGKRGEDFPFMDHVNRTTAAGVRADVAAAVAHLRSGHPDRTVVTLGFCFGGSNSWQQAANHHGLAGAIGFYGNPLRVWPPGAPAVVDRVGEMDCPILGLMAGDDPGIPADAVTAFERALAAAGVQHDLVTYPGAPHSFFDRKQEQFRTQSADAWERVLAFLGKL